jgi:hypothetical protein
MKLLNFLAEFVTTDETIISIKYDNTYFIENIAKKDIKFIDIQYSLDSEVLNISAKDNILVIEID